ncbi:helix-turn-helix transcriptional regulator [Rickettsiales endosymbiont of Stachyamoeba lipophora]
MNGKRTITAEIALIIARHFGTTLQFWLNLQNEYDLKIAEVHLKRLNIAW